jgi:two-component system, LytTR family, sensor kinase
MRTAVNPRHLVVFLHILVWCTILLLPFLLSSPEHGYRIGPLPGGFFVVASLIHMGIFYLNALYLYPRFAKGYKWLIYLLSAVLLIFFSFQLKYIVLVRWFPEVLREAASMKFVFAPSVIIFVLSVVYRRVIDKIRYEREQKEKQAQHLSTELKFLRSQISPHFLFNVLTNLVALARKKSDQLEPSLLMLADLMRYMLYDAGAKKVPLKQEIAYVNSYIALQKLRFGGDVAIKTDIVGLDDHDDYQIEPMLLIPFVENAFKHGVGSQEPCIFIQLKIENQALQFDVQNQFEKENDGHQEESSGIGLANVQSRLNLLYPNRHRLTITQVDGVFRVTLYVELT